MINKIFLFAILLLAGCSSFRYPSWESVSIENSVNNKPCDTRGTDICPSKYTVAQCTEWHKKRATRHGANTVVFHHMLDTDRIKGRYYECGAEIPLYKAKPFDSERYKSGNNTVTGQAFLRQNGGGIVTCAGMNVQMIPDIPEIEYFDSFDEVSSVVKVTQCDAQGNFEFHKIPSGKWIIRTNVSWSVYGVNSVPLPRGGNYYYTENYQQGGNLMKNVTVQDGEVNRFILSQ